jgi:O-acetyl-ADP-ribose deacetylase (regulator of RNase III)
MQTSRRLRSRHGKNDRCLSTFRKKYNSPSLPVQRGSLNRLEIIHTVGPIYFTDETSAPELLATCYRRSLDLAKKNDLKSITFPSLSTGVYGYDVF